MIYLIPALIDSQDSEILLQQTISHIPDVVESNVIVISQGRRPTLIQPGHVRSILNQHFNEPIGKWSAILFGRNLIASNDESVVLLDDDDPVDPKSFQSWISHVSRKKQGCFIGRRSEISLYAHDAISKNSRFFLEVYCNTLLLQQYQRLAGSFSDPPDIQSGLYALPAEVFKKIDFSYVRSYGGELAMCAQLWDLGIETENAEFDCQPQLASPYGIRRIFSETMNLPFFQSITAENLVAAMNLAPQIYRRYFTSTLEPEFFSELQTILAFPRAIAP